MLGQAAHAPLQVAEAAHAQAHPLGQLFLGQARGESVTLEECRWDALVSQLEQVTVVFEGVTPALRYSP